MALGVEVVVTIVVKMDVTAVEDHALQGAMAVLAVAKLVELLVLIHAETVQETVQVNVMKLVKQLVQQLVKTAVLVIMYVEDAKVVQVAVKVIARVVVVMDVEALVAANVEQVVVLVRDVLLVQVAVEKVVPALVRLGVQGGVKEAVEIAVADAARLVKVVVLLVKEAVADAKILVKQNVQVDVL